MTTATALERTRRVDISAETGESGDPGHWQVCEGGLDAGSRLLRLAAENDGFTELEAELEVLQSHHGEVGTLVLGEWGFALGTLLVVQHHHHPEIGFDPACYVVALADVVAHDVTSGAALGIGVGSPMHDGALDDDRHARQRGDLLAGLEIDLDLYQAIVRATATRFSLVARRFAMG